MRIALTPLFDVVHRESGELLSQKGNRLLMIEAWVILLLTLPFYFLSHSLLQWLPLGALGGTLWGGLLQAAIYFVIVLCFSLFVTLPLLYGILGIAELLARDGEAVLADLFAPFSSGKRYAQALGLAWSFLWRFAILFGVIFCSIYFPASSDRASAWQVMLCAALVLLEIAGGVAWLLCRFCVPSGVLRHPDIPVRTATAETKRMWKRHYAAGAMFWFRYLPNIALGLLTVGIYLFAEVLPRMSISYFRYCGAINESLNKSEESNHE